MLLSSCYCIFIQPRESFNPRSSKCSHWYKSRKQTHLTNQQFLSYYTFTLQWSYMYMYDTLPFCKPVNNGLGMRTLLQHQWLNHQSYKRWIPNLNRFSLGGNWHSNKTVRKNSTMHSTLRGNLQKNCQPR